MNEIGQWELDEQWLPANKKECLEHILASFSESDDNLDIHFISRVIHLIAKMVKIFKKIVFC